VRARALIAACLAVAVALPLSAAASAPSLRSELAASLRGQWLSPGRTAAYAVDLRTGKVLFAHNASSAFVPASNAKLPVAWAALLHLGPGFHFRTEVFGVGSRSGRIWRGDLVVRGHGDPTLSTSDLAGLAAAIRAEGITRVTGWIEADESFFDSRRGAPGWKWGFVGIESPPLSALAVDRAAGWPAAAPPLLAAKALRLALQRQGVSVANGVRPGRAPAAAILLASDTSRPLAAIVREMNAHSDNYTAELVLKALGASVGEGGTTAAGARVVRMTLQDAGIWEPGLRIADGSGLSSLDRLSVASLVGVIQAALDDPRVRAPFLASLAVSGRTGTLRDRLPALRWKVRGKTGTTNVSSSLSGVIGDSIAFAVIENGSPVASWAARAAQDRFVTVLAHR